MHNAYLAVRVFSILSFAIVFAIEIYWQKTRKLAIFDRREVLCNLALGGLHLTFTAAQAYQQYFLLTWIQTFSFVNLAFGPKPIFFVTVFLATECIFYWSHRLEHRVPLLWAIHASHHSDRHFSILTAYRLSFLERPLAALFYAPLALIGFPPGIIVLSDNIIRVASVWTHTRTIGRIPFLEGIVCTPSAHRVHHGCEPEYVNKNFGTCLMIWDRIFGSYKIETHEPCYGVTSGTLSYNPLKVLFYPFLDLVRKPSAEK